MARRSRGQPVNGWLNIDKASGMTSTQVVSRVKALFDAAKAGHAGTLDPMATGVLPVALGAATKTVHNVMESTKSYRFTVAWGRETDTDDGEGKTVRTSDERPADEEIEAHLAAFSGDIMQVPPTYSAVKVAGERAYDLAREGEDFALAARPARIDRLEMTARPDRDHAVFEADCAKGTYVRAIARDLGRALGCFGHISALSRTRVGPFDINGTISLDKLEELRHSAAGREGLMSVLKPVETALDDIPALAVSGTEAARLKQGQSVLVRGRDAPVLSGPVYATSKGLLVALGEVEKGTLRPTRVFNLN